MKTTTFLCPKCGGLHFGTTFPDALDMPRPITLEAWKNRGKPRRYCHDEFNRMCSWRGADAECMVEVDVPEMDFGEVGDAASF